MSSAPKFNIESEIGRLNNEELINDFKKQQEHLMTLTALVGELFVDGERRKAYDLFNNASKGFGMYAMMTGLALLLADKEMKLTRPQIIRLIQYAGTAAEMHDKHNDRARNMAQVFVDELKLDPKANGEST